jgi:hypothetical protein
MNVEDVEKRPWFASLASSLPLSFLSFHLPDEHDISSSSLLLESKKDGQ